MATNTSGSQSDQSDGRLRRPSANIQRGRTFTENLRSRLMAIPRRRLIACFIAGGVALVTGSVVESAREQAASWSAVTPVLVATEEIRNGDIIGSHNTSLRSLPLALLPSEPLGILNGPAFAATTIGDGQILTQLVLSSDRDGLGIDMRALTLPLPLAPPPVDKGDLVEIFGVHPGQSGVQAIALVELARVVAITQDGITVAVTRQEVGPLLRALATGSVEFARRPS